jgi:hypothetical protein
MEFKAKSTVRLDSTDSAEAVWNLRLSLTATEVEKMKRLLNFASEQAMKLNDGEDFVPLLRSFYEVMSRVDSLGGSHGKD